MSFGPTASDDPLLRQGAASVFGMVLFAGTVAAALTVLPAAIAAIAGEALRLRSWIYYVLAGGAAMAAIPVLACGRAIPSRPFPPANT
jgi:hypothetical protein